MRVHGIARVDREALVPERGPPLVQKAVRALKGVDACDPHLLDQPILRCPEAALDAPLRLGRTGQNHLDAQHVEPPRYHRIRPLFLPRQPLSEVPGMVGVDGQRPAVAAQITR